MIEKHEIEFGEAYTSPLLALHLESHLGQHGWKQEDDGRWRKGTTSRGDIGRATVAQLQLEQDAAHRRMLRTPGTMMLQEWFAEMPWHMMVSCILLNQTTRAQVDKVIFVGSNKYPPLFTAYPTPERMKRAEPLKLASMLYSLGFQNRRAQTILRFTDTWLCSDWSGMDSPEGFPGIGDYAMDSWRVFMQGNKLDPERVGDKEIKTYLSKR